MKRPRLLNANRLSSLGGVVALMVLAVAGNVLAARHYKRWDVTEGQRYSLSKATVDTLRALPEAVHVWVLMGPTNAMAQSVKQSLVAYQAETDRIHVKYIDPERDALAFEDARKRFRIETARASEGQIVTDAVIVVFMGDRYRYISADDLLDVSGATANKDGAQVRPREEQAITLAIRHVVRGEKTRLCFTRGHGELNLEEGSDHGLGVMRDVLEKDNYDTRSVDLLKPNAARDLEPCDVIIVPGPRDAFTAKEDALVLARVQTGVGLFVAASPLFAPTESGTSPLGLDRSLAVFGVATVDALVVEHDTDRGLGGDGIAFVAEPAPHAITAGLVPASEHEVAPRIAVQFARPFQRVPGVEAAPAQVLRTSDKKSYAVTNVKGAAEWTAAPAQTDKDLPGPITVGMACELPKSAFPQLSGAAHGPRLVALGSASFFAGQNFREPLGNRGAALLVESAISWIAAKPPILDIPAKQAVPAGIRITEASRDEVRRYVLVLMPGAVILLALALFFSRRSREGRAYTSPQK